MSVHVSSKKHELYDIVINGVEFKNMEKVSEWESFEKYVGVGGKALILASYMPGVSLTTGYFVGDLLRDGRELFLVSGDYESMLALSEAELARRQRLSQPAA